jgi:hypothetical protein
LVKRKSTKGFAHQAKIDYTYYMKENNELQKLKEELKKLDTYISYMEDRQGFCERKYKDQFWDLRKKIEETIAK